MKEKNTNHLFSFRALEMQELDRKRISMDIHDTTVQNLTSLVHKTEYVTKILDVDPIRTKIELNLMTKILRDSIEELREIIYDLRPMCIDDLGLIATIDRYMSQMQAESETLKYCLEVTNEENLNILPIIKLTIFRIVQEALVNVKKHAKATSVYVNVIYESDCIKIKVRDNGIGFVVDEKSEKMKNFGLLIMKERVKLLSGIIQIDSKIGRGTTIQVKVPVVEEEEYDVN